MNIPTMEIAYGDKSQVSEIVSCYTTFVFTVLRRHMIYGNQRFGCLLFVYSSDDCH